MKFIDTRQAYINYLFIRGWLVSLKWKIKRLRKFYSMYIVYCRSLNSKLSEEIYNLKKQ